jgi:hypothetical protein
MSVFQDGSKSGQEILDGRSHFGHANDIHDGLECSQYGAQNFRVFLAQVLVQNLDS